MTYLHCPRCRLSIRRRAAFLTMTNCPRCMARAAIASPLFASPLNAVLQATAARPAESGRTVVVLARTRNVSIAARAAVRRHAARLGARAIDDACLLVSELVTNALMHGSGEIRLSIDVAGTRARFAVRDEGDGLPVMQPLPDEHGGWGLQLVDRISERWGVETGSAQVWFEMPVAAALSGTAA